MKKIRFWAIVSSLLVIAGAFSGCSQESAESLLPTDLARLFVEETAEAADELKLSDYMYDQAHYGYIQSVQWGGEALDTVITLENKNSGRVTYAEAQKTVSLSEKVIIEEVVGKFNEELSSPISYTFTINGIEEVKQELKDSTYTALCEELVSENEAALSFTYLLPDTETEDRKFFVCVFIRTAQQPDRIVIRYFLTETPG